MAAEAGLSGPAFLHLYSGKLLRQTESVLFQDTDKIRFLCMKSIQAPLGYGSCSPVNKTYKTNISYRLYKLPPCSGFTQLEMHTPYRLHTPDHAKREPQRDSLLHINIPGKDTLIGSGRLLVTGGSPSTGRTGRVPAGLSRRQAAMRDASDVAAQSGRQPPTAHSATARRQRIYPGADKRTDRHRT